MKLKDLRRFAKKSLAESGISDADSSKLELLFEYAFNFSRNFILSEPDFEIAEDEKLSKFKEALASVCQGMPVQYVVGFSYFCGNKYVVTPDVLIPRQETELLVDMGVKISAALLNAIKRPAKVLDLCSGSGAIGIAVRKACPGCEVTLSDVSSAAINVSKKNAEAILGAENAVTYKTGSFLDPFTKGAAETFDVILSNPPYIPTEVIKTLPRDVRDYEPRLALDGGAGGLLPYEKIAADLDKVLCPHGAVIFEIGEEQGAAVSAILKSKGFTWVEVVKDLDGRDRFVAATRAGSLLSESDPLFDAHRAVLSAFKGLGGTGGIFSRQDIKNASERILSENKASDAETDGGAPVKKDKSAVKEAKTKPSEPVESRPAPALESGAGAAFTDPVTVIKGVGPKTEALLGKLGVNNIGELLAFYPSGYEDRQNVLNIRSAAGGLLPGESVFGTLLLTVMSFSERGNPRNPVFVYSCTDGTGIIDVVFFNNKYVKSLLRVGRKYYFYGRIRRSPDLFASVSMQQPRFADASSVKQTDDFLVLSPVYRTGGKLGNKEIANAVKGALLLLGENVSPPSGAANELPAVIRKKYNFRSGAGLVKALHFPESAADAAEARRRIEFEKLLDVALNIRALKDARDSGLPGISFKRCDIEKFKEKLPFKLTDGQLSIIDKILSDMESKSPMNRLINGDVGSGKTVVALAAIFNAVSNGMQAALMVPSTVLASQHMSKVSSILSALGIDSEMLYSATKAPERRRILKRIEDGDAICLIGTHSLIGDNVNFKNLGLVVIDEQHRFGVLQRASLIQKSGSTVPDVLSLTATPIPRSLALILYGDMDISVLTEKPAGRLPVATYLYTKKDRPAIYRRAADLVKSGGRVYIVHAKIDKNDNDNPLDANADELLGCVENHELLSKTVFAGIPTGLIHGKLSDREKQAQMDAFASGETKVLFATTVIEVGVDVPSATLMIIEDAERFGLSTLHQLRGRVGRGSEKSYCILISDKSSERLEVMTETNDGFKIAEKDLELRGPGDFFGTAQTGAGDEASAAASADPRMLEAVKESADLITSLADSGEDPECASYLDAITAKAKHITL